jgi:hypothetical protein
MAKYVLQNTERRDSVGKCGKNNTISRHSHEQTAVSTTINKTNKMHNSLKIF